MRWFRFYDDALNDPKVQRLSPHLFRAWVNCLCLASKSDGRLPSITDIAFNFRMSENDAKSAIEDLILAGLIDICRDGGMEPHNWSSRQFSSDKSKDRTRKWRQNKNKTSGDVTVTARDEIGDVIESETDTDTDTYGLRSFPSAAREDQKFKNGFRKDEGRGQDRLVRKAEGLGIPVSEITAAVNRHKAKNRPAYFTKLCVEWLLANKLPGLDEKIIRDALWGTDDQYAVVMQLLVRVAA